MLWLKEIHLRKVILSLKKEKKLFNNKVLGKTEHPMRDLTREDCHEEGVEFEEGNVTFKVRAVASIVDHEAIVEKKASFMDKSLNVMSFGKLGSKEEVPVPKKEEIKKVEVAAVVVEEVAVIEEVAAIEELVVEEEKLVEEAELMEEAAVLIEEAVIAE